MVKNSANRSQKAFHLLNLDNVIACGKVKTADPLTTKDITLVTCKRCHSVAAGGGSGGRKRLDLDTKMVRVGFYDGDLVWAEEQPVSLSELIRNSIRINRRIQTGEIMVKSDISSRTIITITSSSGGTGKTTTCRNLGAEFARQGKKVLLVDLDPQANLDLFCGLLGTSHHANGDISKVFEKDFDGIWPISSIEGEALDVVRSSRKMIKTQGSLTTRRSREKILSRALKMLPDCYEVIILDCPATGGYLVDNALAASTHVLAPIILEEKSIQGLGELLNGIRTLAHELEEKPPILLGVIPIVRGKGTVTARLCQEGLQDLAKVLKFNILPEITEYQDTRKASGSGFNLRAFRPGHPGALEFENLAKKIGELLRGQDGKG